MLQDPVAFFGGDAIQDPYPLYDRLRADGPVHRVGDSGFYLVCSWAAINDAINRPEDFSSNLTATMMFTAEGTVVPFEMDGLGGPTQMLATADDPAHAMHRKMLVPQLAAKRIRAMEPFIADTFDRLWADGLRDGRIEWMGALANRLPMMVVAQLIGVPAEDVDQLGPVGMREHPVARRARRSRSNLQRRASRRWNWAAISTAISAGGCRSAGQPARCTRNRLRRRRIRRDHRADDDGHSLRRRR